MARLLHFLLGRRGLRGATKGRAMVLKYVLFAAGGGLWLNGLIAQLDSTASAGKYLVISAVLALVSLL